MGSLVDSYLARAENELILAKINLEISINNKYKEIFMIEQTRTFFNDVISQAYYSIFYAAKAFLLSRNIETKAPEEHKKTYEEFKKFVFNEVLNKKLLEIYETETLKAESLLKIFFSEKKKRAMFTYNLKSEANLPYAKESLDNARKFISSIKTIIELRNEKER